MPEKIDNARLDLDLYFQMCRIDDPHVRQRTYAAELREVDHIATESLLHLSHEKQMELQKLARHAYEVDLTCLDTVGWDDLDAETQSHYKHIALFILTHWYIRVDPRFHA